MPVSSVLARSRTTSRASRAVAAERAAVASPWHCARSCSERARRTTGTLLGAIERLDTPSPARTCSPNPAAA